MPTTSVKSAIAEQNAAFADAFNRGDAAGVAALYTANAYLLPPGAPMVQGRAAIQGLMQGTATEYRDLKFTTLDLKPYTKNAVREVGRVTMVTRSAPHRQLVGKYLVLWENIRGRWRLASDCVNFDSED